MSGTHLSMIVIGALLALVGLAAALPVVWRLQVRGGPGAAGVAGKLEPYVSYALLTFVAGVGLMALPFLLPVPVGGGRTASPRLPAAVPTMPGAPAPGGATTIRPPSVGATAQSPASGTAVPTPDPVRPTGVPTTTQSPLPSAVPFTGDISGRWSHANGSVELREATPGQFTFRGFDTLGRLVAEGTAVRSGSRLTLAGTVPGFGLAITGELQIHSGSLIQGTLRDPLGITVPLVLSR